jgi:hypothetical protein
MKNVSWMWCGVLALVMAGCQRPLETHFPEAKPGAVYRDVEPGKTYVTGQLTGVVEWVGEKPKAEPICGLIDTKDGAAWGEVKNPFLPKIDKDGMVEDAVIQVLNPPAEMTQYWMHWDGFLLDSRLQTLFGWCPVVCTVGESFSDSVGFIKVGREVVLKENPDQTQLRARGAAFFTKSFPTSKTEHKVIFDQPGLVEFTKTNGDFSWYKRVWICEHPYFAFSDGIGFFSLGDLPPGVYDIQASIPNWEIVGRDRDPETGRIMQLYRGPDIVVTQRVKIEAGKETKITLKLSSPAVPPPAPRPAP